MDREELRDAIDSALDIPLAILAFLALVLIIIDLTTTVPPVWRLRLDIVYWFVWGSFLIEYLVKLLLSVDKRKYVTAHWVELAIIAVPFLRILRILKVVRLTRSVALLRFFLFSRLGLSGLEAVLTHRIAYLLAVTTVVVFLGAVGGAILEIGADGARIRTFGDALWWSTTLVTTVASEIFPVTTGGRILAVVLQIYGVAVFTFLSGTIAAYFIGKQKEEK